MADIDPRVAALPAAFRCDGAQPEPASRPEHNLTAQQRTVIETHVIPGTPPRPLDPALGGSLPASVIRERMESNRAAVQWCFDTARTWTPEAHGRVAIRFAIAPDGGVAKAVVESNDTGMEDLGCCIARKVESWTFPPPDGGGIVIVTSPFLLVGVLPGPFRCDGVQPDPRGRPHHNLTAQQRAAIETNLVPGASLRPLDPAVAGSLPKRAIHERIENNLSTVRWCLGTAGPRAPELRGRVVIKFAIAPDGGVAKAIVESNDTGVADLGCCIARHVETWTFPAPDGGGIVFVTYPFSVGEAPAP